MALYKSGFYQQCLNKRSGSSQAEMQSPPPQGSKRESFPKMVNGFQPLTIAVQFSILDACICPGQPSDSCSFKKLLQKTMQNSQLKYLEKAFLRKIKQPKGLAHKYFLMNFAKRIKTIIHQTTLWAASVITLFDIIKHIFFLKRFMLHSNERNIFGYSNSTFIISIFYLHKIDFLNKPVNKRLHL